jgi:hypothetical protein
VSRFFRLAVLSAGSKQLPRMTRGHPLVRHRFFLCSLRLLQLSLSVSL